MRYSLASVREHLSHETLQKFFADLEHQAVAAGQDPGEVFEGFIQFVASAMTDSEIEEVVKAGRVFGHGQTERFDVLEAWFWRRKGKVTKSAGAK
jgi:hypothetical protein